MHQKTVLLLYNIRFNQNTKLKKSLVILGNDWTADDSHHNIFNAMRL